METSNALGIIERRTIKIVLLSVRRNYKCDVNSSETIIPDEISNERVARKIAARRHAGKTELGFSEIGGRKTDAEKGWFDIKIFRRWKFNQINPFESSVKCVQ